MGARTVALLLLVVASCQGSESSTPPDDTCKKTQPLNSETQPLRGQSLADKQLALTFDDGPGARTAELSTYLKSKNIRAAFFVNGMHVAMYPNVLAQLVADGHVVANHTQTHPTLSQQNDATIVKEVADTDALIAPFVPNNRFLFRAPYGAYDAKVFAALEASAMKKYVGHVDWDIGDQRTATTAADWACWDPPTGQGPKLTSQQCGDLYRMEINAKKKGIVLMHDPWGAAGGNTVDMVKYLVPLLEQDGFTFKRVDEVPDIAAKLPPLPVEADAGSSGSSGSSGSTGGPSTTPSPPGSSGSNPCP